MKWVAISPLVGAPQIAKPPPAAQKVRVRAASARVATARRAGPGPAPGAIGSPGATGVPAGAPGATPRSAGRWAGAAAPAGSRPGGRGHHPSEADRHPDRSLIQASTGRKVSWPVALAAVRTPMTSPRRRTNQRLARMATKTRAIDPVPRPISTPPQQDQLPAPGDGDAQTAAGRDQQGRRWSTARTPKRSMRAAANGAVSPNSTRLTPTASDDQAPGPAELLL